MSLIEDGVLGVHIVAGFLALGAGAGAALTTKGGLRHRRFGRAYVYAMAVVSATALGLLAFEQSVGRIVLGLIAVFSFYFAFSGYRVLSRKRAIDTPGTADWVGLAAFVTSAVGMLGAGAWFLLTGVTFGTVLVVFGVIALVFARADFVAFRASDLDPRAWFFEHIRRMGGAYIATVSAFTVVNATFLPTVARWLLPTVVGTLAIWYVSRQYRQGSATNRPTETGD